MTTIQCQPSMGNSYDNNNEANVAKLKQQNFQQHSTTLSSVGSVDSAATVGGNSRTCSPIICNNTTTTTTQKTTKFCGHIKLNSLWSVWYGIFGTFLQAYTVVKCTKRFLRYSVFPWPPGSAVLWELHICLLITGLAVLLLPLFLACAVFQVGNFANDACKLGRGRGALLPRSTRLWKHAGPTAASLHLVIAAALLAPRLVMEARLLQHGFLPPEALWRTDLDFMMVHQDRLVVLSFMSAAPASGGPIANSTSSTPPTNGGPHSQGANYSIGHDMLNYLRGVFHLDDGDVINESGGRNGGNGVSVEFANYAVGLVVYAVRYAGVFWRASRGLGALICVQLLGAAVHCLLTFAAASLLYKLQILGAVIAPLPLTTTPFFLTPPLTLVFLAISSLAALGTGTTLYLYALARYKSFLWSCKERTSHITPSGSITSGSFGGYRIHVVALGAVLLCAAATAPLLHDLAALYRGSLDGAALGAVAVGPAHLALTLAFTLVLAVKQRWNFRVTLSVAKATLRSARSLRLVTDLEVGTHHHHQRQQQPLLVVGNGRAYTITETASRKSIMNIVQKSATSNIKHNIGTDDDVSTSGASEQIYWLRGGNNACPQRSPDSGSGSGGGGTVGAGLCWLSTGKRKQKVTFNETSSTSYCHSNKGLDLEQIPDGGGTVDGRERTVCAGGGKTGVDEDDGDYATLRVVNQPEDECVSEVGKLLACMRDDSVTYASTSRGRDLEPDLLQGAEGCDHIEDPLVQSTSNVTPRCLRRADSGVPADELTPTPRSDSVSTEASTSSPPDHSETSSGVHSTSSSRRVTAPAEPWPQQHAVVPVVVSRIPQPPLVNSSTSIYGYVGGGVDPPSTPAAPGGVPAVIVENAGENTVLIRRKSAKPLDEDPFSRSTNMKMTSFTEHSATLPHFPTQPAPPPPVHGHCSTMPLPHHQQTNNSASGGGAPSGMSAGSSSCQVYSPRQHTTIPIHHNGVRLFPVTSSGAPPLPPHSNHSSASISNPYIKRVQQNYQQNGRLNNNLPGPASGGTEAPIYYHHHHNHYQNHHQNHYH